MGKFKTTATSMDVLQSAKLEPGVKIDKDGNVALVSVRTTKPDMLCPAQGRVIRQTINEFNNQLATKIVPGFVIAETDDDLLDAHESALGKYLANNNTTVQAEYEKFLDTKLGNYNDYRRLNKFYM